jgi:hypothetical protein
MNEICEVNERQARLLEGDPFFVILDALDKVEEPVMQPALLKVQVVDDEPLQAQPEVVSEPEQENPAPTLPTKVRKPRSKKK